jgi:hypothetical protein
MMNAIGGNNNQLFTENSLIEISDVRFQVSDNDVSAVTNLSFLKSDI